MSSSHENSTAEPSKSAVRFFGTPPLAGTTNNDDADGSWRSAALIEQAPEGEFRSNLHRGGSASLVRLTPEERSTAVRAAKIMGLEVCGVDLLRSNHGAVVMEVMRILKTLDLPLRRTIRIGLWMGEEQGLIGSRGYVRDHADELERIAGFIASGGRPQSTHGAAQVVIAVGRFHGDCAVGPRIARRRRRFAPAPGA